MMFTTIKHVCMAGTILAFSGCAGTSANTPDGKLLKIAPYKVPCTGEGVQLCYRIEKEDGKAEFFYDEIDGFAYEWGYRYEISVEEKHIANPPADGSSKAYRLTKVLKKEKAATGDTFELPLRMNEQSLVENRDGGCSYFGAVGIETGTVSCDELAKGQTAVFRHQGDRQGLVLVQVK